MVLLESKVFQDDRGFFFDVWNSRGFESVIGLGVDFVQDNHSGSH